MRQACWRRAVSSTYLFFNAHYAHHVPMANAARCSWECPGGLTPSVVLLSIQINGVDMTEARHDQAVALLTGTSPTIALLVERDLNAPQGSPGQSRARAHSPPPPEPSDSPDQEEEGLSIHGNHLSRMEDEYPIEVTHQGLKSVLQYIIGLFLFN